MVNYTDKEEYFWDSQWKGLPALHLLHPLPTHTLDTMTLGEKKILFSLFLGFSFLFHLNGFYL